MLRMKFYLILLVAISGALANKCRHPNKPPVFSKTYKVSGSLSIPYAELVEPFTAWYDPEGKSSRIDYYNGMVSTYQLAGAGPFGDFGTNIKIAPMTNEEVTNAKTCFQVNGTTDGPVDVQSILPDTTGFACKGPAVVHGVHCEKWEKVDVENEKVSTYTLYIKWKNIGGKAQPVPVRYEMRGYNSLLGSHYDHYYLDYDSYSVQKPSPEVFEVDTSIPCGGFPGPGNQHGLSMNPMSEFINGAQDHIHKAWDEYKTKHGKSYQEETEHDKRKEVFKQNYRYISSSNRAGKGFTVAVNHLADRTDEELKVLRGTRHTLGEYNGGQPFPYDMTNVQVKVPEELDWRLYGAVTPVKDQSVCGSCWSFGTTGTIEGAYFLKTGNLTRLSPQALIDCSWGYGNNGCDGGEDFRSYAWMLKHGGIPMEEEYGGYLGQDGYCHIDKVQLVAPITGWVNVTSGSREALKLALFKHGPISVSIDAAHKSFSFYSNGVYYEPECLNGYDQLDHSVLAVGYGKINGQAYWLIKNSWSNMWGNDGYVLMAMKNNNCGVMTSPTYVTM